MQNVDVILARRQMLLNVIWREQPNGLKRSKKPFPITALRSKFNKLAVHWVKSIVTFLRGHQMHQKLCHRHQLRENLFGLRYFSVYDCVLWKYKKGINRR